MANNPSYDFSNQEISQLFENVAAALELKKANRFRLIAYQNASAAAEHATSSIKDLWQEGKLDDIPGFGQTIQEHLNELFTTGKVKHFEEVLRGINPSVFAFLSLPSVGPKTAEKLASAGIKDVDDLSKKLISGKLDSVLSEKLRENLKLAVQQYTSKKDKPSRMLLPFAAAIADDIMEYMRKSDAVIGIDPLGSLRRRVATIGDLDFSVASTKPQEVINHFIKMPEIAKVVDQGEAKSSAVLKTGVRVDLMVVSPDMYGSLLQHFTGSKMHNIHLRKYAKSKGLSLSEKGIKQVEPEGQMSLTVPIKAKTEQAFYKSLKMDWMPPEIREDTGEIEAAINHKIPTLVELKDIRGDLHIHSSYPVEPSHDLGADSMQALIKHAKDLGYEYINLTDHNPALSTHSTDKIISLIEIRTNYIEQLNSSSKLKLLNSLEIDILPSGELAIPEKAIKMLDLPICGIHSKHNQPKDEITKRLTIALENPYLKILVHPTNRLLNQRDESQIDWDVIFDVIKKNNKVLEINAYPDRLDLTDALVREAVNRGIKMVIDTDSHAVKHMDNMQYGVDVARRGWATKADIINTYSWPDFKKFFGIKDK